MIIVLIIMPFTNQIKVELLCYSGSILTLIIEGKKFY